MTSLSKMHKTNLIAGGTLLLYGIWLFTEALAITGIGRGGEPGPAFLPRIIGVMLICLSAALLLRTLVQIKMAKKAAMLEKLSGPETAANAVASAVATGTESGATSGTEKAPEEKTDVKSIVFTFVLFIFYSASLARLGFILTSITYAFLQMLVLSVKPTKKQIVIYAFISIAAPTFLYFLFLTIKLTQE